MPIMMILIFGFALSNEIRNAQVAIVAPQWDDATKNLVDRIDQSKYFQVVETLSSPDEIETSFKEGKIKLAIVFGTQFEHQLQQSHQTQIQLIGDASDPNTASMVIQYASAIIGDYQMELFGEQQQLPYKIEVENSMLYNPQLESSYTFVPGVMTLILMLLGAMMTSVSIVKEKEKGTMEILLVSPMKPLWVLVSKAIPYLVLCFIDVLLILFLATVALGMPIRGSLLLLLGESLLFIFTTLSLGLLISTKVDSQQVATFISLVGFMLPAIVFSGFMFPIENMPLPLQVISNIVPTRWYYEIISNIMVKGLGLSIVWKPTLILLGMTVFFIALAIRNFKIRLE
jgi:ABC-2 type transport system permease protein